MATGQANSKAGVFWPTVNGAALVVLPFVVFTLFARMMAPAELALVMLAMAMLELLKAFGPQGVYDVLLTYPEDQRVYYRAASAVLLGGAGIISLLYMAGVALSPWLLDHQLPAVLLLLTLKIVFDYAQMQPQAVMVRRGALRRLGSRGLAAGLIAGAGGLLIGLVTTPILGLTCYYVLQSLVAFLMTTVNSRALIAPGWNGRAVREMRGQATRASGVRLSAAVTNYMDQLLLGSILGAAQVGAYNLGKRLEVVSMTIGGSFSQLAFQRVFLDATAEQRVGHIARGMAAITLVCGVPAILLAIYHRDAIPFVFGPQWAGAAVTAALLTGSGYVRAVGSVAGALYTVTGRNGRLLALSTFGALTNMLMILIFVRFGIEVAAGAVLVRNSLQTVAMVVLTGDARGHVTRLFLRECLVPLAVTGLVGWAAGALAAAALPAGTQFLDLWTMAAGCVLGAAAGFLALRRRL